jgi:hypothetical protein
MSESRSDQLLALLRRDGPQTAAALGQIFGVSQPTVSRALAQAGEHIVRIGRARSARYALARDIGRAGNRWPLYRIDATGHSEHAGELRALHAAGFHFEHARPLPAFLHGDFSNGLFPGLPWFLDDQRPQGFLGREFARRISADIGANPDLLRWQEDDVVLALLRYGSDQAGDLVLGEESLQTAMQNILRPEDPIPARWRDVRYPIMAEAAIRGENIGSSAGGEQPKFTAVIEDAVGDGLRAVIVKFSERSGTPAAERWADLLRCEHVAGEVLRAGGLEAAASETLESEGRVFLESTRFDRTPELGRRGFVSLAALDAAFYGHGRIDWWRFAPQLQRDGWIDADDARRLRVLGWFGALIGNTDMHLGNAGLMLADTRPLTLTPAYDMLPMAFRPASTGEIVERQYVVTLPTPEFRDDWRHAAVMADAFWERTSTSPEISGHFRAIVAEAHAILRGAMQRHG